MNILAACSGRGVDGAQVHLQVVRAYSGCDQDDPAFFDASMGRPHPPRTPIERDIVEAEASVKEFTERNPDVAVTILRFANVLGPDERTEDRGLFDLPVIPMILGLTRAISSSRGRRRRRAPARGRRRLPGISTWRRRRARLHRDLLAARQAFLAGAAAVGDGHGRAGAAPLRRP